MANTKSSCLSWRNLVTLCDLPDRQALERYLECKLFTKPFRHLLNEHIIPSREAHALKGTRYARPRPPGFEVVRERSLEGERRGASEFSDEDRDRSHWGAIEL
jgi:hypothetical protein